MFRQLLLHLQGEVFHIYEKIYKISSWRWRNNRRNMWKKEW